MMLNDSSNIKVPCGQTPLAFLFGCDRRHMLRHSIMSKKIIEGLCNSVRLKSRGLRVCMICVRVRYKQWHQLASQLVRPEPDLVSGSGLTRGEKLFLKGPMMMMRRRERSLLTFAVLLVQMSKEASAFIEASFNAKLKNSNRTLKAEKLNLWWLKCTELEPVVSSTIPAAARCTGRATSRLQNYWLDTVNLLVYTLEKAELDLPAEVFHLFRHLLGCWAMLMPTTQQLGGNLSWCRWTPIWRTCWEIKISMRLPPCCLGRILFCKTAALTKTLNIDKPCSDFHKGHS